MDNVGEAGGVECWGERASVGVATVVEVGEWGAVVSGLSKR